MTPPQLDVYQDPLAPGSLVSTLRIWQALKTDRDDVTPHYVSFSMLCPGEAQANRLANALRRRLSCRSTRVSRVEGGSRDIWQVEGVTQREVQSLENLEQLSSWLRAAAVSHQVRLMQMSVIGSLA